METNKPQHNTISETVRQSQTINKEEEEILLDPYNHILQTGNEKLVDLNFPNIFNYWLKIPQDKLNAISDIIHMMETVGFMFDDIQDDSPLRDGGPTAHNVYGIASTLNTVLYIMTIGLKRVMELNHPEAAQIYAEQVKHFCAGQGTEIYWRDNYICPSEAAYKRMAIRKMSALVTMMWKLMQLFSDNEMDVTNLIGILGLYCQIRNDYSNLYLDEYAKGKGYCEDLTEGKFSFPIIHAIQKNPGFKEITNILKQRTKDIEVKRYCLNLLKKFGSDEYTRTVLEELDKEMRDEVERLDGNPLFHKVLDSLLNWKN
ncbi:unnamed protein product [Xylocopa violacea]|uniref:Geranylgeranyl pyrophosphate synthase n=1 Tax=Xylocopa violacea TaxID=135666 RepID=A0ABP1NGZ4_XYLVO